MVDIVDIAKTYALVTLEVVRAAALVSAEKQFQISAMRPGRVMWLV